MRAPRHLGRAFALVCAAIGAIALAAFVSRTRPTVDERAQACRDRLANALAGLGPLAMQAEEEAPVPRILAGWTDTRDEWRSHLERSQPLVNGLEALFADAELEDLARTGDGRPLVELPKLLTTRCAANLLNARAALALDDGDVCEALRRLRQTFTVALWLRDSEVIGCLVQQAIVGVAVEALFTLMRHPTWSAPDATQELTPVLDALLADVARHLGTNTLAARRLHAVAQGSIVADWSVDNAVRGERARADAARWMLTALRFCKLVLAVDEYRFDRGLWPASWSDVVDRVGESTLECPTDGASFALASSSTGIEVGVAGPSAGAQSLRLLRFSRTR